jgi:hypothetical protein
MELVRVTYPAGLLETEVDRIAAILDDAGISAELMPAPVRMGGIGIDPWTVEVTVTTTAFFAALGTGLGKDSASAILKLVRYVHSRRHPGTPPGEAAMTLNIEARRVLFVYPADLEDCIVAQRRAAELMKDPRTAPGIYRWNTSRDEWTLP